MPISVGSRSKLASEAARSGGDEKQPESKNEDRHSPSNPVQFVK